MEFNKKEAIRYLGFYKTVPDENTQKLIDEVGDKLLSEITPKSVYKKYPITVSEQMVTIDNSVIHSKNLSRHLKGCKYAYLFAATLGIKADSRIRAYAATSMSRSAIAQSVSAALIETYCDEIQAIIAQAELQEGHYLKPRFSPGYGDFPIEFQKELLPRLDAAKRIGITLTDSCLMVPTKSVSAVIGVTDSPNCNSNRCINCDNTDCEFREEA